MRKPTPIQKESLFKIDELFFSTTDHRGVILYGNEVFMRVSGYTHDQMIGSPHNIIRHPDMPKVVFKLLWDTIQAGKMIAAYVKNMAIDGSYYWVLAVVFPVGENYISIRLKPTSGIRDAAESIYNEVLNIEKKKGVEASGQLLMEKLNQAGFKSYEEFMTSALYTELSNRDQEMYKNKTTDRSLATNKSQSTIKKISDITNYTSSQFRIMFKEIKEFGESSKVFSEKTQILLDSFIKHSLLSLNMQIMAEQIGLLAAPLAVVAGNFEDLVRNIDTHLRRFAKQGEYLSQKLQEITLSLCIMKTVTDMLEFFVKESLSNIESQKTNVEAGFIEIETNSEYFKVLADRYTQSLETQQKEMAKLLVDFTHLNTEVRKFVNNIELISKVGSIESARITSVENHFNIHIQSMREFSHILNENALIINSATKDLGRKVEFLGESLGTVYGKVDSILDLVNSQKS